MDICDVYDEFCVALELWFNAHNIPNLLVDCGESFCFYHDKKNLIEWGEDYDDINFEQFFYEYGCTLDGNNFVKSLLHEVGHYMTMSNFTQKEWNDDKKTIRENSKRFKKITIDVDYWYWELPTEFSANMWAINYINTHKDDVNDLITLCNKYLSIIEEEIG